MGVREAMQRLTHREFLTLRAWLEKQWNKPSRGDWHILELIAEVRSLFRKRRAKAVPLKFERKQVQPAPVPPAPTRTSRLQQFGYWLGLTGWKPRNPAPEKEAGDGN